MKIAVLDDGVNAYYIKNGVYVKQLWGDVEKGLNICHGTKVISTIEKYCPIKKAYYIYNIMNLFSLRGGEAIIVALKDLLIHKVDVILMCLVVNNSYYYKEISRLCNELVCNGSIIIASASNAGGFSFPANIDNVIGVGRMVNKHYDIVWHKYKGIQILGDVTPEYIEVQHRKILFNGTSKAAAKVAATVLRQCADKKENTKSILLFLEKNFQHNFVNILKDIEERKYIIELKNRHLYYKILQILEKTGYNVNFKHKDYYFEDMVDSLDEFGDLVINICNKLGIFIDFNKLHYIDFMSIYSLSNFLGEQEGKNG